MGLLGVAGGVVLIESGVPSPYTPPAGPVSPPRSKMAFKSFGAGPVPPPRSEMVLKSLGKSHLCMLAPKNARGPPVSAGHVLSSDLWSKANLARMVVESVGDVSRATRFRALRTAEQSLCEESRGGVDDVVQLEEDQRTLAAEASALPGRSCEVSVSNRSSPVRGRLHGGIVKLPGARKTPALLPPSASILAQSQWSPPLSVASVSQSWSGPFGGLLAAVGAQTTQVWARCHCFVFCKELHPVHADGVRV
jgi:hypothetical protein